MKKECRRTDKKEERRTAGKYPTVWRSTFYTQGASYHGHAAVSQGMPLCIFPAKFQKFSGGLAAPFDIDFPENVVDMRFGGGLGNDGFFADLRVVRPFHQITENLHLPRGQLILFRK